MTCCKKEKRNQKKNILYKVADFKKVMSIFFCSFHFFFFFFFFQLSHIMNNDNIDLHVRWSDRQDLVLNVNPDETIYSIKEKV